MQGAVFGHFVRRVDLPVALHGGRILPLLLSTRQRRNDMNGRDEACDVHHCCDCVSLQYGSRNLAADCIRKGKRIRSRQADDATFFKSRSL